MENRKVQKIAFLLFTRTRDEECLHKPFLLEKGSVGVLHDIESRIEKAALSLQVPVIHINGSHQRGKNFHERLCNAFEFVFNAGYDAVIAIGNDTPRLSKHHLSEAMRWMRDGGMVIGPSKDGGIYLLGVDAFHFNCLRKASIPWLTKNVYRSLAQLFSTVKTLSPLSDLDDITDVHAFYITYRGLSFTKKWLAKIICQCFNRQFICYNLKYLPPDFPIDLFGRPPPHTGLT